MRRAGKYVDPAVLACLPPLIGRLYEREIPFAVSPVRSRSSSVFAIGIYVKRRRVGTIGGIGDYVSALDFCHLIAEHVPGVEVRP
ncbi:MAG: hypothetical protein AAF615_02335 [Pseudomonadota bacterium]